MTRSSREFSRNEANALMWFYSFIPIQILLIGFRIFAEMNFALRAKRKYCKFHDCRHERKLLLWHLIRFVRLWVCQDPSHDLHGMIWWHGIDNNPLGIRFHKQQWWMVQQLNSRRLNFFSSSRSHQSSCQNIPEFSDLPSLISSHPSLAKP